MQLVRVRRSALFGALAVLAGFGSIAACSSDNSGDEPLASGGSAGQNGAQTGGLSSSGGSPGIEGGSSNQGGGEEGGSPDAAASGVCSEDGWCWDAPQPQGNALRAVWAFDWSNVWAVGDAGTVIHYDGRGFSRVELKTSQNLNAIWGSPSGELWVAGDADALVHFDGQSWQTEELPAAPVGTTQPALNAIWGNGKELWISGSSGRVFHSDGTGFTAETTNTQVTLRGLWTTELGDVLAVGDSGVVLRRTAGAWKADSSGTSKALYAIRGLSATDIYAAGVQGAVIHYDGKAWKDAAKGATLTLQGDARAIFPDAQGCWWVGAKGKVFYKPVSTEANDWQDRSSSVAFDFLGAFKLDGRLLAVGQSGSMVLWDGTTRTVLNSGSSKDYLALAAPSSSASPWAVGDGIQQRGIAGWIAVPLSSERALYGLTFLNANTGLAVGTAGTILRQNGSAWIPQESGTSRWLRAVWSDGLATWVVGEKGTILGVLNGSFLPLTTGFTANLYDVWGASADVVWAVGDGEVLRYTSGKWERFKNPLEATTSLRGIWGSSATDAWAVGTRGTVLHWNGTQWTLVDGDQDYSLNDIWGAGPDRVWAVGTAGTILHFDGSEWKAESSASSFALNAVWGGDQSVWAAGEGGTILKHAL